VSTALQVRSGKRRRHLGNQKIAKPYPWADRVRSRATTKPVSSSDLHENLQQRRSQIREFEQGWGRFRMGFIDGCLRNKWPQRKNLLAMKIGPDINDPCGASRGSMSRNCENSQNPAVYSVRLGRIERLLRPALRRHGFAFQWISSKRAADSQHTGCRW